MGTIQLVPPLFRILELFGMAVMPFLCNVTLLFHGNLPRVLLVIVLKYACCLIPYIVLFLFLCEEWSSLVFKDFQKYCCFSQMLFFSVCCNYFEDCLLLCNLLSRNYKLQCKIMLAKKYWTFLILPIFECCHIHLEFGHSLQWYHCLFEVTDCVGWSTQNVSLRKETEQNYSPAQRNATFILHWNLFHQLGRHLQKAVACVNILHCTKTNKNEGKISQ